MNRRASIHSIVGATLLLMSCARVLAADVHGDERDTAGWQLVWADEFNQEGKPDIKNWRYEGGFVRHREAQWYQPQNAWCENGCLVIEARREQITNPDFDATSEDWRRSRRYASHTSASLRTEGLHSWKFGRFEMRGKIDTRSGMWPTFWTMGVEGDWPHSIQLNTSNTRLLFDVFSQCECS